jgi:predicted secreted hydrolase
MLFHIRRKDGTFDRFSSGTYVDSQGKSTHLTADEFILQPLTDTWTSPVTGAVYSVAWKIGIRKLDIELEARTPLPSQELAGKTNLVPSYWEGAITLAGKRGKSALGGVGYLEMTGYDRAVNLSP